MAYGYSIEPQKDDVLVNISDQMMREFALAASPMSWAVDIIPALRHLPEGFPGAGFKKTARQWRKTIQATAMLPYRFVQRAAADGNAGVSYVSRLIQQMKEEQNTDKLSLEDEEAIIWSAASLYGAAADTTVITLTAFTLAMIRFPHVQRKAQEEIDRVIGRGTRLPTVSDRDSLPYTAAIVQEAIRWWPVNAMGFPHLVTEAFEYQGYTIPEGAFLLPAVYWFLKDPSVHPDPEDFQPERFLEPRNEPLPLENFGFGRRICPGRFFADDSLFVNIAQTLACFTLKQKVGADGQDISVDQVTGQPGILTYPTHFECTAVPRTNEHLQMLKKFEKEEGIWEAGDGHLLDSFEEFQPYY